MGRPLSMAGAHCRGQNSESIGIAYVGGKNASGENEFTMTPVQANCIKEAIAHLRSELDKELPVHGHREFRATFCPGFDVQDEAQWPDV